MSETFKVEKEAKGYKIIQTKEDIIEPRRVQQIYASMQQTIKNLEDQLIQQQTQIDKWPEQKQFFQNEIAGIKMRMTKIEPFIAEVNTTVKLEDEKNKRLKEKDRPEEPNKE